MRVRLGSLIALLVLALLVLGACGGESRVLTTEEYADAMEEAHAALQDKLMENAEAYEDSPEEIEKRLDALDSARSDEKAELVREIKERIWQAMADVYGGMFAVFEDYHDDISKLRPPAHLSDLHNAMTAGLEQFLKAADELLEELKDRDRGTWSGEDFGEVGAQADEACEELRTKLEAELGRDVAICD